MTRYYFFRFWSLPCEVLDNIYFQLNFNPNFHAVCPEQVSCHQPSNFDPNLHRPHAAINQTAAILPCTRTAWSRGQCFRRRRSACAADRVMRRVVVQMPEETRFWNLSREISGSDKFVGHFALYCIFPNSKFPTRCDPTFIRKWDIITPPARYSYTLELKAF